MSASVPSVGLTPEQHAARAEGVGASEVHDALFNQAELWLKKTRRVQPEDDDALSRLGHAIEPYIIGECVMASGLERVMMKPATKRRGRMVAHLDAVGIASPNDVVIEAKWRGSRDGWGEPGTADVPRPILLQTMAQMHVAELRLALVPVLFLRPPVAIYEIPYDTELAQMIEAGVDRFWHYVEKDITPEVNADAPEAIAVLRKLYPGTNGKRITATREAEHWRTVCQQATAKAKDYEHAGDVAKAHLLSLMEDNAELEFADGTILRRKSITRKGYTVEPTTFIEARFTKAKE